MLCSKKIVFSYSKASMISLGKIQQHILTFLRHCALLVKFMSGDHSAYFYIIFYLGRTKASAELRNLVTKWFTKLQQWPDWASGGYQVLCNCFINYARVYTAWESLQRKAYLKSVLAPTSQKMEAPYKPFLLQPFKMSCYNFNHSMIA